VCRIGFVLGGRSQGLCKHNVGADLQQLLVEKQTDVLERLPERKSLKSREGLMPLWWSYWLVNCACNRRNTSIRKTRYTATSLCELCRTPFPAFATATKNARPMVVGDESPVVKLLCTSLCFLCSIIYRSSLTPNIRKFQG
jgi:hypothetical protein